ncbi:peptidase M24, structural domain-containing protein [Tirmania nivea]|nr:peptidase M24, structural domain-containing protein [Tirmania nivea]
MTRVLNCTRALRAQTLLLQLPATTTIVPAASHFLRPPPVAPIRRRNYATESAAGVVHASQLSFGQPIHETHPYLIGPGELTRNITAEEYHTRRTRLTTILPKGSLAIIPSSTLQYRSGVVFHEFHQNPDFLYLTGWTEPSPALAVLESLDGAGAYLWTMFVTSDRNSWDTLWNGPVNGLVAARDVWNADEVYSIDDVDMELPKILARSTSLYATPEAEPFLQRLRNQGVSVKRPFDLTPKIAELRIVKSPGEIRNMRLAGRASGRGFNKAMSRRWRSEAELWAYLAWRFRVGGCEKEAYVPVVAGGRNACTIHYTRNDEELRDGELVLVDAAGQYSHYPSDITRTWPVNGVFTEPQRDLYQAVLNVQKYAITLAVPGNTINDINNLVHEAFVPELQQLGERFTVNRRIISTLNPHSTSHHIGLSVHDVPSFSSAPLRANHCITIEPGIYIPHGDLRWPEEFWGMGIRIEDVVCVEERGEPGPLVLSREAVKEVVDVEALGRKTREREERRRMKGKDEEEEEEAEEEDD